MGVPTHFTLSVCPVTCYLAMYIPLLWINVSIVGSPAYRAKFSGKDSQCSSLFFPPTSSKPFFHCRGNNMLNQRTNSNNLKAPNMITLPSYDWFLQKSISLFFPPMDVSSHTFAAPGVNENYFCSFIVLNKITFVKIWDSFKKKFGWSLWRHKRCNYRLSHAVWDAEGCWNAILW